MSQKKVKQYRNQFKKHQRQLVFGIIREVKAQSFWMRLKFCWKILFK